MKLTKEQRDEIRACIAGMTAYEHARLRVDKLNALLHDADEYERLRTENARLLVAKLPTSDDYNQMIRERDALKAEVEQMRVRLEASEVQWSGHCKLIETERDQLKAEIELLREFNAKLMETVGFGVPGWVGDYLDKLDAMRASGEKP